MQHHIQTLVKHFFHKESLQEVTVNQLQQFIDDYPYSAVGQLLLAKKLRDTGAQNFDEQGGKATLYFHDPVWASWLLKHGATAAKPVLEHTAPVNETPHFVFNNIDAAEVVSAPADTPPWEETTGEQEPAPINEAAAYQETEAINESPEQQQHAISEQANEPGGQYEQATPEHPVANEPGGQYEHTTPEHPVAANEPGEQHQHASADQPAAANESADQQQPVVLEQPGAVNQFEPLREEPVIDQTAAHSQTPAAATTNQPATPVAEKDDPGFEPYHTIDYFASLGIKLKPEELAKDKLGQQLKSFTDWLRSMKKITPAQGAETVNELDDLTSKSIQKIAEFSNEAKEIITEAMAEVWAKQGHIEKAVAIYEKLSLLNPSKSSYFAARIDALKS